MVFSYRLESIERQQLDDFEKWHFLSIFIMMCGVTSMQSTHVLVVQNLSDEIFLSEHHENFQSEPSHC